MPRWYFPTDGFVFGQSGQPDWEVNLYERQAKGGWMCHPVVTIRSWPDGFPKEIWRWAGSGSAFYHLRKRLKGRFKIETAELMAAFQATIGPIEEPWRFFSGRLIEEAVASSIAAQA